MHWLVISNKTKQTKIKAHIFQKSLILYNCRAFSVLYWYNLCSDSLKFKKGESFFQERIKTMLRCYFFGLTCTYLLCWMYCGQSLRYALGMNDTRGRCAREVRYTCINHLCKIMQISWKFFKRMNPLLYFTAWLKFTLFFFYKHITKMVSPCIKKSWQPECLDGKATDRFFLRSIHSSSSWETMETIRQSNALMNPCQL